MKRIYAEVVCNYNDEGFWYVDAWKTSDGNEDGTVIAVINELTGGVYAIGELDDIAKEVIDEKVKEIEKDRVGTLAVYYSKLTYREMDEFLRITGNP